MSLKVEMSFWVSSIVLHRFWVVAIGSIEVLVDRCQEVTVDRRLSLSVNWRVAHCGFTGWGLGGWGFLVVNSSWVMILTVSHDATDSIWTVDRCWAAGIDWCSSDSIGRCSSLCVDRHQCELLKLIELSTSKSPSWRFSSLNTFQKSSSMMAFTWYFIVSSHLPLRKVSCFLKTSHVWTTCVSNFFTCVLKV